MTSDEKMRELIEELWESDAASALTNRAARALESVLHSVEAEKDHHRLIGKNSEEAYSQGFNDGVLSVIAKKERLVELAREMFSADSACGCGFYDDDRWRSAYFGLQVAVGSRESTCVFDPETDEFPAPTDHKPE